MNNESFTYWDFHAALICCNCIEKNCKNGCGIYKYWKDKADAYEQEVLRMGKSKALTEDAPDINVGECKAEIEPQESEDK